MRWAALADYVDEGPDSVLALELIAEHLEASAEVVRAVERLARTLAALNAAARPHV